MEVERIFKSALIIRLYAQALTTRVNFLTAPRMLCRRILSIAQSRRKTSTLRTYAISRFPGRGKPVGAGRQQNFPSKLNKQPTAPPEAAAEPHTDASINDSPLWKAGESLNAEGSEVGLARLLENESLVIERYEFMSSDSRVQLDIKLIDKLKC